MLVYWRSRKPGFQAPQREKNTATHTDTCRTLYNSSSSSSSASHCTYAYHSTHIGRPAGRPSPESAVRHLHTVTSRPYSNVASIQLRRVVVVVAFSSFSSFSSFSFSLSLSLSLSLSSLQQKEVSSNLTVSLRAHSSTRPQRIKRWPSQKKTPGLPSRLALLSLRKRSVQDLNLCGQSPRDFESLPLTTRATDQRQRKPRSGPKITYINHIWVRRGGS